MDVLAQSHIPMHNFGFLANRNALQRKMIDRFHSPLVIFSLFALILTATSCGTGNNNSGLTPIANPGGPYLGNANQALSFDGSGSSAPNGKSLVSFLWSFGDGGTATTAKAAHAYTVAGNYTATLTVTDSSGVSSSASVAVQIIPAPVAKPGGPYAGKVGVAISFNGSASTAPPGQALGFTWNFGDGATATGATPSHAYGSVGTFTVTLTVSDDTAGTSFATTTATITAGPAPGNPSATSSTFFAIGPAANASTQFAYVVSSSPTGVTKLTITTIDNATGELHSTDAITPKINNNFVPSGLITDPARRFLYLYGGNSILSFQIDSATGSLTPSGSTISNSGAGNMGTQRLTFEPTGQFGFFVAQESGTEHAATAAIITSFSVSPATGVLIPINAFSAQVQNPQAVVIEPGGKYLYISGNEPGSSLDGNSMGAPEIAIFSIELNSGAPTAIVGSPVPVDSGFAATAMAADTSGRHVYAAGRSATKNDPAFLVFSIDGATGSLSQNSAPLTLPDTDAVSHALASVSSIALSPSGDFGYVVTVSIPDQMTVRDSIRVFHLDAQTGIPTAIETMVWNRVAPNSTLDPAGSFMPVSPDESAVVYTVGRTNTAAFVVLADSINSGISLFSINSKTGSLDFVASSSGTAGH